MRDACRNTPFGRNAAGITSPSTWPTSGLSSALSPPPLLHKRCQLGALPFAVCVCAFAVSRHSPQLDYLSATAQLSSDGERSPRYLRWFGRVVTAVPTTIVVLVKSVPHCRAVYYFCCGRFAPDGAWGSGLSRQPPLGGLRPFFKSPPAPFVTLGRSPEPTVRPRRARAPYSRAPLSSGAPLLRATNSAPEGASPSLRSGLRVRQVARWITSTTFGVFMTKHSVTMFRSRPPQTSFRHKTSPHIENTV